MTHEPRILRFYLDGGLRQSAELGQHNFIGKIENVARDAGYRIAYCPNTPDQRARSAARRGYAIYHMDDPQHDRALTIRRVYYYPFWAIESSAKRWQWRVARTPFQPDTVRRDAADRFYRFWQERLFGALPQTAERQGFVYVPLQGRLCQHRSFQTCAPIKMLEEVLAHDPARKVIATLHPKEIYTAAELDALEDLTRRHTRLSLRTGEMETLLAGCDYVVTQNSGAAFAGYFFAKPAVLFARIDFHHIAANVADLGVRNAVERGPELSPDFAGYVHWFWQEMSINAGRGDAEDKIRRALSRAGWPM